MGDDMFNEKTESVRAPLNVASPLAPSDWVMRFVRNLAAQDYLLLGYFGIILVATALGSGPTRAEGLRIAQVDFAIVVSVFVLVRAEVLKPSPFSAMLYRTTLMGAVVASYFQLRTILPAVSDRALDGELLAFDLRVFGFEPSLSWDKYVNPTTTEWFAFFYYSYFFILSVHILGFVLFCRDHLFLARFAFGIFGVFCTAHLLYMVVPGYGPYHYAASQFQHQLSGGLFWGLVRSAVDAAGAQKDIFPSLHTAVPTFFFFFSFRHRHMVPFKYTWPLVAFFASQIIVATMFLRWHYLVDICAGITLAATAAFVCERVEPWETKRRIRFGVQPVFAPFSLLRERATSTTND